MRSGTSQTLQSLLRTWPSWVVWSAGWSAMLLLDPGVDLANLALVLVLTSACASL